HCDCKRHQLFMQSINHPGLVSEPVELPERLHPLRCTFVQPLQLSEIIHVIHACLLLLVSSGARLLCPCSRGCPVGQVTFRASQWTKVTRKLQTQRTFYKRAIPSLRMDI